MSSFKGFFVSLTRESPSRTTAAEDKELDARICLCVELDSHSSDFVKNIIRDKVLLAVLGESVCLYLFYVVLRFI